MNVLLADAPIAGSKLQTTKFCLPETGFIRLKNIIAPYGPIPVSKEYLVGRRKIKAFSATNQIRSENHSLAC